MRRDRASAAPIRITASPKGRRRQTETDEGRPGNVDALSASVCLCLLLSAIVRLESHAERHDERIEAEECVAPFEVRRQLAETAELEPAHGVGTEVHRRGPAAAR